MSFSSPVATQWRLRPKKIVLVGSFHLKILPGSMLLQNYREPCIIYRDPSQARVCKGHISE